MRVKNQIISSAEPFLFQGGRTGCLLIHGFTGAPKEMRLMGEFLNKSGFTCLGIRLTGHATDPRDMIRSRWTDWTASVEDGYHLLRGLTDAIYFIGLSMGGALSLLMSTRLDVKGVVAMSTPYDMPVDYPLWVYEIWSNFFPYREKAKESPGSSWFDKQEYQKQVSYPQNPVRSAAELSRLLEHMRPLLPEVRVPVKLIHSQDDRYVLPQNMESIYADLVNAPVREKMLISGSGHVVTRDASRNQVFETALEFIRRIERQP